MPEQITLVLEKVLPRSTTNSLKADETKLFQKSLEQ